MAVVGVSPSLVARAHQVSPRRPRALFDDSMEKSGSRSSIQRRPSEAKIEYITGPRTALPCLRSAPFEGGVIHTRSHDRGPTPSRRQFGGVKLSTCRPRLEQGAKAKNGKKGAKKIKIYYRKKKKKKGKGKKERTARKGCPRQPNQFIQTTPERRGRERAWLYHPSQDGRYPGLHRRWEDQGRMQGPRLSLVGRMDGVRCRVRFGH